MTLEGKKVLVTGGGSGIGLGIARSLATAGAHVAICGRNATRLESAASGTPTLQFRAVDVGVRDEVTELFTWFRKEIGEVDILVNSAGTNIPNRTMREMRPEQWDQVLAINATGVYNCMYEALADMRPRRDGLIVNISSIAGKRATDLGGVAYAASKFAMSALGTAVANEDKDEGIRITNIYPGEVNTPILDNRPVPVSDEHKAQILQPEDVADIVLAICKLPPRAHVAEMIIKPTTQGYV